MVLVIGIIIWVIGIVYGAITFYRLKKTKKEYEEAQREEVDATADKLMHQDNLPKNDSGQEESRKRDETIDYLIELSDNSVPITLSSLIRTLYNEPGYALRNIEKGCYGYGTNSHNGYKTLNIVYTDKNRNYYDIYIADSEEPYTSKEAKIDDQVIIVRIEERHERY